MTAPETVLGISHPVADVREFFDDLEKADTELLAQVRAERQRH
jgi:hypothetical protein